MADGDDPAGLGTFGRLAGLIAAVGAVAAVTILFFWVVPAKPTTVASTETIVQFARVNGVSQIFLSREADSRIGFRLRAGLLERLVSLAHDMQVTIVGDRSKRPKA